MFDQDLQKIFQQGDIVAYYIRPGNAAHHHTWVGHFIHFIQRIFWWTEPQVDPSVTHVGLIDRVDLQTPIRPGFTPMKAIEILKGKAVEERFIEHNYAIEVFRLHPDLRIHSRFNTKTLAAKALEVAREFQGSTYSNITFLETFWWWYDREGTIPSKDYTDWISERFKIDPQHHHFEMDRTFDGVICAELVLISYQIAWLLLAGEEAMDQALPGWLNFHAKCTPAGLIGFIQESGYYKKLSQDEVDALRYSGEPDPRDLEMPSYVLATLFMARRGEICVSEPESISPEIHPRKPAFEI